MARDLTVKATIIAEDKASKNVKKVETAFQKLTRQLRDRFVITAGDVVGAFKSIIGAIGGVVDAAAVQEAAVIKLDAALSNLGQSSAAVSKRLQQQASALQSLSTFGDEVIIEQQAFLASLNLTEKQIKEVTVASIELASTGQVSLESAFRNIAKSFSGLSGELGELIPQLRSLSAEQLIAGEGVKVITELFGGQAAASVESYAGQVAQLSNDFGDLKEGAGQLVIAFNDQFGVLDALNTAVKFYSEALAGTAAASDAAARGSTDLIQANRALAEAQAQVTREQALAAAGGSGLFSSLQELVLGSTNLQTAQVALIDAQTRQRASLVAQSVAQKESNEEAQRALDLSKQRLEETNKFTAALNKLGIETQGQVNVKVQEFNDLLKDAFKRYDEGTISAEKFAEIQGEVNKRITELKGETEKASVALANNTAIILEGASAADRGFQSATLLGKGFETAETKAERAAAALRAFTAAAADAASISGQAANAISSNFGGSSFDTISQQSGRAAATQAAVSAGGTLSNAGRRISLPGGGSRLTTEPGLRTNLRNF